MAQSKSVPLKGLGWLPDLPDPRDRKFRLNRPRAAADLRPTWVDLRPKCQPPWVDQLQTNSCVGNAIAGLVDYLHPDPEFASGIFMPSSRRFIYWGACERGGFAGQDSGCYIRDGMKAVAEGVPHELACRFSQEKITKRPNKVAFTQSSRRRKIGTYHPLGTVDEMKDCLAEGFPFVFGISVFDGFFSDATAHTGRVEMPGPDDRVLGGHAMLCVGYDAMAERFIFRNSWGDWGDAGTGTIPFAYLGDPYLGSDFWTARL